MGWKSLGGEAACDYWVCNGRLNHHNDCHPLGHLGEPWIFELPTKFFSSEQAMAELVCAISIWGDDGV